MQGKKSLTNTKKQQPQNEVKLYKGRISNAKFIKNLNL